MMMDDRVRLPLEAALAYLNEQPPRVTMARDCIKAALAPGDRRWDDEGEGGRGSA